MKEIILILKLYCDESHDPHPHRTYVVAGCIADEQTWSVVEHGWAGENRRSGVSRFHAVDINGRQREFEGWQKGEQIRYTKALIAVLKRRGKKLLATSVGLYADEYREIISPEGQIKFGHPYHVCFKTLVAMTADNMSPFPQDWKLAVIFDRQTEFQDQAVRTFYEMKDNLNFAHRHRLESCTTGDSFSCVGLQVADLFAYESFRLTHDPRIGRDRVRPALKSIFERNCQHRRQFGRRALLNAKELIERSDCAPNGLVIIPTKNSFVEDRNF